MRQRAQEIAGRGLDPFPNLVLQMKHRDGLLGLGESSVPGEVEDIESVFAIVVHQAPQVRQASGFLHSEVEKLVAHVGPERGHTALLGIVVERLPSVCRGCRH